jgi:hypothetical protein
MGQFKGQFYFDQSTAEPPHSAALAAPKQLVAAAHGPTTTCSAGVDGQPAAAAERPLAEVALAELRAAAVEKACPGQVLTSPRAAGLGLAHPAPRTHGEPHACTHAPTYLSALVLLLVRWLPKCCRTVWFAADNPCFCRANQPLVWGNTTLFCWAERTLFCPCLEGQKQV